MGHSVRSDDPTIVVKALASFVLGGLAIGAGLMAVRLGFPAPLVVMLAPSLFSILLGRLAQWEVRQSNGRVQGSGLAGWGIFMSVVGIVFLLLAPQVSHCGGARRAQAANNLKQIGLALSSYREDHGRFPPAVVYSPDSRPLYSWRVLILPYLEQKALYDKFDLNEPWDSPHNHELLAQRPSVYDPVGIDVARTLTYFQVFIGVGTAFEGRKGTTLDDFPDGPERTLLVVEAADPVPWAKPMDLPYMAVAQLPPLGGVFEETYRPFDATRADGFHLLLADTSVRFVRRGTIGEAALRALITRNGNESIDRKF
jgi:Protein of unknown function (DUF1559)